MVDWKLVLYNVASSLLPRIDYIIDKYVDEVLLAPKYEEFDSLERESILAPYHEVVKNLYATALEPYAGKVVEIGHTECPYCRALYEKIQPYIMEGKVDVLWIDQDPLAISLVADLDIREIPYVVKVEKDKNGEIVLRSLVDDKVVKFKDNIKLDLPKKKKPEDEIKEMVKKPKAKRSEK